MKPFDYYSPGELEEVTRILADYGREGRALAGGTDLLIRLKRKQWHVRGVVSLKRLASLRQLSLNGELRIGARVTLNDLIHSPFVREHFSVLSNTASRMAGVQVRSLATVGGNICNASPSADMAPPLIALQARAIVVEASGERVVPLDEFFTGPGQSVLAPGELVREILVPHDPLTRACYLKLEHREAMDIAIAGVGVSIRSEKHYCQDARIVLGAVAPVPLRARKAEEFLRDQELTGERIREAARLAAAEAKPIDDVRGSAWYRREMIEVLTRRALMELTA